ncbi:putative replication factor-a protein [Grosmannia clavigera kw1407]|uniref:Putative replication factor-a protein n=1 Tax=Grosmannia clavigera (strain kw1407 / UAMH 11150) TaxID=655863 RepID=F0XUW4_GROCL|nr:putative replication factor-a protein [Grosmannia clavigera kw1407]EFW98929.1 putative replication factor-a protein [Grosmannia clavigera kw1407]
MASYGGYAKTSYGGEAVAEGGGGFMGGGSQSASQGGRNYNEDSLRPVTIKQLLDTEEAYPGASEFTIDGAAATQLTLVGQVRAVNPQPTNVTYRIDDGTGCIEVKKWVDADKNEEAEARFALDQHVRVFGRLKLFNQKRYVGAHFLRAIDDYNEVSYHMLECTYVHLCLTRGAPEAGAGAGAGAGAANSAGTHNDSMFVDQDGGGYGGGSAATRHLSPNGQKIYHFLRNMATGNEGINVNVIINELKLGYGPTMTAIQELTDNAVIFATVDDETFALM